MNYDFSTRVGKDVISLTNSAIRLERHHPILSYALKKLKVILSSTPVLGSVWGLGLGTWELVLGFDEYFLSLQKSYIPECWICVGPRLLTDAAISVTGTRQGY